MKGIKEPSVQIAIFMYIVIVPLALTLATTTVSFSRAQSVEFCMSCHVMAPYAADLKDPSSELLAAKHYRNRRINRDQCFTCHSDYDFLGPIRAKVNGLKHMIVYYSGMKRPLELYKPYKNANCLTCHADARSFKENPVHLSVGEEIKSGEMSCLSCHGPVHPKKEEAP